MSLLSILQNVVCEYQKQCAIYTKCFAEDLYVMDGEEERRSAYLFGRDISEIPCFRNSYLYGIGGGFGTGLAYFLISSNPRMSTHVGFAGFVTVSLGFWVFCRYRWAQRKFTYGQLQAAMKKRPLLEGTEAEENLKEA